jgi:hypothetical protein
MSDIITATEQPQSPRPPKRHRVRNTVLWISGLGIALIAGVSAFGGAASSGSTASTPPPAASAPAAQPSTQAPTPTAAPATEAQQQALDSASSYLDMGTGFSRHGLIEQLTSSAGDGFARADAVWAVNRLVATGAVNWKQQAVLSAKGYLKMGTGFSRASLIDQLSSSAGEGFTLAQATYAADQVGL